MNTVLKEVFIALGILSVLGVIGLVVLVAYAFVVIRV